MNRFQTLLSISSCAATQWFPDAVNQPAFASCMLAPGQTYRHDMVHRFFTQPTP